MAHRCSSHSLIVFDALLFKVSLVIKISSYHISAQEGHGRIRNKYSIKQAQRCYSNDTLEIVILLSFSYVEKIPVWIHLLLHISAISVIRKALGCSVVSNFLLVHLIESKLHILIVKRSLPGHSFKIAKNEILAYIQGAKEHHTAINRFELYKWHFIFKL